MRIDCKVIEDVLPLYLDKVCSEQTREMVEEHLETCENCKKAVDSLKSLQIPQIELENQNADYAVKKGLKKIRVRWWASVFAVILIIPILLLTWNQCHGRGICFTNIREFTLAKAFVNCLEKGDYEKAYSYININGIKQEWEEEWFDEAKLKNIQTDGLNKFCEYGERLEEYGGIQNCKYVGIVFSGQSSVGKSVQKVAFKIEFAKKDMLFDVMVSDDGVEFFSGGGSFVNDPLAQFSIWSEYLWQYYEGCYFDSEIKDYVYIN